MDMPPQIMARRLYPGGAREALTDQVIEIADGRIAVVRAATAQDAGVPAYDIIVPGFIDLQINGAADVQFNFDPTPEAITRMAQGARRGGTAHILPTFITAPGRDYTQAIAAVRDALAAQALGVLGLHLEGPFLSPERPGIHPAEAIRAPGAEDILALEEAAADMPLLLTLAPECQERDMITRLARAGATLFAGHTAATAEQVDAAKGLRGVTHLFNAMSQMEARAPGVVGAVLASDSLFAGIIADGHHVDWRNIALAAKAMDGRLFLVTDAMQTLAGTQTRFDLYGKEITLADGRLTDGTGRLAGAHIDMIGAVRNVVNHCNVPLAGALDMASGVPARAMGLGDHLGRIAIGFRASLTCLTGELDVARVIVDGQQTEPRAV